MICPTCREGGRYNRDALECPLDDGVSFARLALLRRAESAHGLCDGWCDCQHFTGLAAVGGEVKPGVS